MKVNNFITFCSVLLLCGCQSQLPPATQIAPEPIVKQPLPSPTIPRDHFRPVQYRIYLPQPDGSVKLLIEENRRLQYRDRNDDSQRLSVEAATESVRRLLNKSPQSFPPGTKIVKSADFSGGWPDITLNRAFANKEWWRDRKRANTAMTALVQTALRTQDYIWSLSGDDSLTIHIENEKPSRLGQFYSGLPITMHDENLPKHFMTEAELRRNLKDYENSFYRPRQ